MAVGVREGDAVLHQIVTDAQLPAEGVPPSLDIHTISPVARGLHEHGNPQLCARDRLHDPYLVTEVGQQNNDPVDFLGVLPEKDGAFARMFQCLNRSVPGGFCRRDHLTVTKVVKLRDNLLAGSACVIRAEESARPHNYTKGDLLLYYSHAPFPASVGSG